MKRTGSTSQKSGPKYLDTANSLLLFLCGWGPSCDRWTPPASGDQGVPVRIMVMQCHSHSLKSLGTKLWWARVRETLIFEDSLLWNKTVFYFFCTFGFISHFTCLFILIRRSHHHPSELFLFLFTVCFVLSHFWAPPSLSNVRLMSTAPPQLTWLEARLTSKTRGEEWETRPASCFVRKRKSWSQSM